MVLLFSIISILRNIFPSKNKLLYSFRREILDWAFSYLLLVIFTSSSQENLFQEKFIEENKQVEIRRGHILTVKRMCQLFLTKLTDDFHCFCIALAKPTDNWPEKRQGYHAQLCVLHPQKIQVVQKWPLLWLFSQPRVHSLNSPFQVCSPLSACLASLYLTYHSDLL